MVRFSELRFSEDKKQMFISCFVENFSVYEGVYIKSVSIEYYKNRLSTGNPSNKAIKIYDNTTDDKTKRTFSYCFSDANGLDTLGLSSFEGSMFYVYVECDGYTGKIATVDCSWGRPVSVGVAIDWDRLYRIGMNNIDSMLCSVNRCKIDSGFVDFTIMWNGFRLALEICDYDTAEDLWSTINGTVVSSSQFKSPCGCR